MSVSLFLCKFSKKPKNENNPIVEKTIINKSEPILYPPLKSTPLQNSHLIIIWIYLGVYKN